MGRVLGSWPDTDQLPVASVDLPSSVARTVPVESRTWSRTERPGSQALAVLIDPFAVTLPPLLNFGLPLKKITPVFFFLPASATAVNDPAASATIASTANAFPALSHPSSA